MPSDRRSPVSPSGRSRTRKVITGPRTPSRTPPRSTPSRSPARGSSRRRRSPSSRSRSSQRSASSRTRSRSRSRASSPSPSFPPAPFVDYDGQPASICVDQYGSYRLHVSNLDHSLSRHDLESAFGSFGPLRTVYFSPQFALLAVEGREKAEEAVKRMDGVAVGARRVKVRFAWPKSGERPRGRGGNNGHFRPAGHFYKPAENHVDLNRNNRYNGYGAQEEERGYYKEDAEAYVDDEQYYGYRDRPYPRAERGRHHPPYHGPQQYYERHYEEERPHYNRHHDDDYHSYQGYHDYGYGGGRGGQFRGRYPEGGRRGRGFRPY